MLDEFSSEFLERDYYRLSPIGKRRARIMAVVKGFLYCGILIGVGYGLCFATYGIQYLLGVAG